MNRTTKSTKDTKARDESPFLPPASGIRFERLGFFSYGVTPQGTRAWLAANTLRRTPNGAGE